MNIGYMCGFDKLECGESEARIRWTHVLEKLGHKVIPLNRAGYTFDSNVYAENLNLDFLITAQVIEQGDIVYPDIFTCFFFWAPSSFFPYTLARQHYNMFMGKYDAVVGGYESKNPLAVLSQSPYFSRYKSLLHATASVPRDFAVPFEEKQDLKLFYVGVLKRYEGLLKNLDDSGMVDIYGPREVFGTHPWEGFKSYRGTIPFDGKSIIQKMHDAGIVLALHSKSHNKEDYVSNRIFEAAAAGAIIIADDNKFIRRYFGDSVYYIDIFKSDAEQEQDVNNIIQEIFNNKAVAFEKARRAQQIFMEKLSLDTQADEFIKFIEHEKALLSEMPQSKTVDCICKIDSPEDFYTIQTELKRQYYKNLHLILYSSDDSLPEKIKNDIDFDYTFVKATDEYFSPEIFHALKGDYFVLVDRYSSMHQNHILKATQVLNMHPVDFAYSASYEKKIDDKGNVTGYRTVACTPLDMKKLKNEILSEDDTAAYTHLIINVYPQDCFVFNRNLLSNDMELCNIPFYATYFALVSKSVLQNVDNHLFMYTLSAGAKEFVYHPQTFMYSNIGTQKDELLDKLRSTYSYLTSSQKPENAEIPSDIKKSLVKILYKMAKIQSMFALWHRGRFKEKAQRIKQTMDIL